MQVTPSLYIAVILKLFQTLFVSDSTNQNNFSMDISQAVVLYAR